MLSLERRGGVEIPVRAVWGRDDDGSGLAVVFVSLDGAGRVQGAAVSFAFSLLANELLKTRSGH
jgi:hypothetical protein